MQQLKERVNIVDILSRSLHLVKKGKNYWASCPFHLDKTPSFSVNELDQFYYCFSCHRSGDVITFLRETQNIDYNEAVEQLCKIVGIEPPKKQLSQKDLAYKKELQSIYTINKAAARHYRENLFSLEGSSARNYLTERGLGSEVVAAFGLGYSKDYTDLPEFLSNNGYSYDSMRLAGLVRQGKSGYYDALATRLIVPIINEKDEVIGFGGRALLGDMHAKYVNTEQTKAFDKRRNLFAINIFKKLKRTSDVSYAILVEGYMDVISLYQEGITNSVAAMGTALTREQCSLLKRFTSTVMVCFDSDSAGQAATLRSLDLLQEAEIEVKVVSLPPRLDPDDTVKKYGKNGFLSLIDKALPLIDYRLKKIEENYDLSVINNRSKYANACIDFLATLKDEVAAAAYLDLVSEKASTPIEILSDNLKKRREQPTGKSYYASYQAQETSKENKTKGSDRAEDIVVSALINKKEYARIEDVQGISFTDKDKVFAIEHIKNNSNFIVSNLFNEHNETEIGRLTSIILDIQDKYAEKFYRDAIIRLQRAEKEKKIAKLKEEYLASNSEEGKRNILMEINQLTLLQHNRKGDIDEPR